MFSNQNLKQARILIKALEGIGVPKSVLQPVTDWAEGKTAPVKPKPVKRSHKTGKK